MALAKPQMRGMHNSLVKRNISFSVVAALVSGVSYYYAVAVPRKQRIADFYLNYDEEKSFARMRASGLLSTCPPE